jgi:hypothetical protein
MMTTTSLTRMKMAETKMGPKTVILCSEKTSQIGLSMLKMKMSWLCATT